MIMLYRTDDTNENILAVWARVVEKNWVTLIGRKRVRRSGMITRYHDTFEQAKYHLRRLQEIRLKHLKQRVESAEKALQRINNKTVPDNEIPKPYPRPVFNGKQRASGGAPIRQF